MGLISFVIEMLFPYAWSRVGEHLACTVDSEETQADLDLLRHQAAFLRFDGELAALSI